MFPFVIENPGEVCHFNAFLQCVLTNKIFFNTFKNFEPTKKEISIKKRMTELCNKIESLNSKKIEDLQKYVRKLYISLKKYDWSEINDILGNPLSPMVSYGASDEIKFNLLYIFGLQDKFKIQLIDKFYKDNKVIKTHEFDTPTLPFPKDLKLLKKNIIRIEEIYMESVKSNVQIKTLIRKLPYCIILENSFHEKQKEFPKIFSIKKFVKKDDLKIANFTYKATAALYGIEGHFVCKVLRDTDKGKKEFYINDGKIELMLDIDYIDDRLYHGYPHFVFYELIAT